MLITVIAYTVLVSSVATYSYGLKNHFSFDLFSSAGTQREKIVPCIQVPHGVYWHLMSQQVSKNNMAPRPAYFIIKEHNYMIEQNSTIINYEKKSSLVLCSIYEYLLVMCSIYEYLLVLCSIYECLLVLCSIYEYLFSVYCNMYYSWNYVCVLSESSIGIDCS